MFTAARLDARECARLGLANRVVPDAALERESLAWARQIAAGPPVALRYMKENLNRALSTTSSRASTPRPSAWSRARSPRTTSRP